MDALSALDAMVEAAVAAAAPALVLPAHLPPPPPGRTIVIGAGKAAGSMAKAVEDAWPADAPLSGLVVTRDGHAVPCRRIEVALASHPVPDRRGLEAASRVLALARGAGADDLVLALISGGGSALLTSPAEGLSLEDKQAVNTALLASGADITAMNTVRKHLSAVKGGRLARAAHPARLVSLLISDVPGDDPATIASGPTVPDRTTAAEARAVLARFGVTPPEAVRRHLGADTGETPKPDDPCFARAETRVIAAPQASLLAAAEVARRHGLTPLILGDAIEGEAREVAKVMAGIARSCRSHGLPAAAPCVLLSGGETTVTVRGRGRGGRNAEFLLALAVALDGATGVHAAAVDTDGIDGVEDNAGARVTPDTLARARAAGLDPAEHLADNDAYAVFQALDDLITTGPTLTNVNDFRAILVV